MPFSLCTISCIITCLYSRILLFSVWNFQVSFFLIATFVNFFVLVIVCVFDFIFCNFAVFLLVTLRTLVFFNWLFSIFNSNLQIICKFLFFIFYYCPSVVILFNFNALYTMKALLFMSFYFSIVQLFYAYKFLEITFKLFKNNIKHNFKLCYLIKNWFFLLINF